MNEQELERLMKGYGQSLGACGRKPTTSPHRSLPSRRIAVASVVICLAAVMTLGFWPQDALSRTIERLGRAITNARTMEISAYWSRAGLPYRLYMRQQYKDGMWRLESRVGEPLQAVHVLRDGLALQEFRRLDHATIQTEDPSYYNQVSGDQSTALDFVIRRANTGLGDLPRATSQRSHEPLDGRSVYVIVLDRAEDAYHAEILVDSQTDLPIQADVTVEYNTPMFGKEINRYHEDYRFDLPLDDSLFALDSVKPVFDLRSAKSELRGRWHAPLADMDGTKLWEASVTQDGTIWLALTVPNTSADVVLPSSLESNLPGEYMLGRDVVPSDITAKTQRLQFEGQRIVIVRFISLAANAPAPSQALVRMAHRPAAQPGSPIVDVPAETAAGTPLVVPLATELGAWPEYFVWLDLDRFSFDVPISTWTVRADALERKGLHLEAARAYEACADAYRGFVKYAGHRPLEKAAGCYEKAGMPDVAARIRVEAERLKESRER